jgi:hypothetical protein
MLISAPYMVCLKLLLLRMALSISIQDGTGGAGRANGIASTSRLKVYGPKFLRH